MSDLTYAIADLHGRFDLFTQAIVAIAERGGGKVVFTGDYVDRGPESRQIIEVLMAGAPEGQTWICLKGNHEDMMAETIMAPLEPDWWIGNGGAATVRSYGGTVPLEHARWVARLPLYHETEHHIFCHAGGDETKTLAGQTERDLCWFRCARDRDYSIDGKHVVHGHTPFKDGPVCLPGRTNLDTGAYATGRLVIGVFDETRPSGPVDVIEITALAPSLSGRTV